MNDDEEQEGMESFSMNDTDLEYAMNPGKHRRQTKEQAVYGMWAERSDSEDESRGRGFSLRANQHSQKAAKGQMSFVSGGFKDDAKNKTTGDDHTDTKGKERTEEDENLVDLRAGTSRKQTTATMLNRSGQDVFAGMRGNSGQSSEKFGGFERHTKGFGMKYMEKLGYQGGGLGSKGQGIVEPVMAAKRPGRGAVGAYGAEVKGPKRSDEMSGKEAASAVDESTNGAAGRKAIGLWRKKHNTNQRGNDRKYRFKTIDDVIEEGGLMDKRSEHDQEDLVPVDTKRTTVKIIDMTGKQQRVYTGYQALRTKATIDESTAEPSDQSESKAKFDVPELRHNLELLMEVTEEQIVRNDKQLKYLQNQQVALKHDRKVAAEKVEEADKQAERMKTVIELVENFSQANVSQQLTLDNAFAFFDTVLNQYYEEYRLFELHKLVVATVCPLIKALYADWQPRKEPALGLDELRRWRSLIEQPSADRQSVVSLHNMDPYHQILWHGWMPCVRRCIVKEWVPREGSDWLTQLIETYSKLLPVWMVDNVLDKCILPQLQTAVDEWNPVRDTVPIHSWLHQWLPLMGDRLQSLYAPIRHKLGKALAQWHPSDPSAHMVLLPWRHIFTQGTMEAFLNFHIVPKLQSYMDQMIVNPANQELKQWQALMHWTNMLSPAIIAQILLNGFFPKWHLALYQWLRSPAANYDEVIQWYQTWKAQIPADVILMGPVKQQFDLALEQMDRATRGSELLRVTGTASPANVPALVAPTPPPPPPAKHFPSSFKDLVERKAVDAGLPFMPVSNKFREGKQVYWFGKRQLYIDNNVVMAAQADGGWLPSGLEALVQGARA